MSAAADVYQKNWATTPVQKEFWSVKKLVENNDK